MRYNGIMSKDEIDENIEELEERKENLAKGSISRKRIGGEDYFYHRTRENGKVKEKYIRFKELDALRAEIEERHRIEKKIKEMKLTEKEERPTFLTDIVISDALIDISSSVAGWKKRSIFKSLETYIYSSLSDRVFILYGLRRTGKTTMIRQLIHEMNKEDRDATAYIRINRSTTLKDVYKDMKKLQSMHYRYVFIDEVTLLEDFIEGAAVFSDIFASSRMKIVLSGTDSLGFMLSADDELYDRTVTLHTTFIPYQEFVNVLSINSIDEYIRYGGTMCVGGSLYNSISSPFKDESTTDRYINLSIAGNIQSSLAFYKDGGHFRALYPLYEKDELSNVIERVVEDINHRFTVETITRPFKSSDLSISARNLRKDRVSPLDILDYLDTGAITRKLMELLSIKNKEEQMVDIDSAVVSEIEEYLVNLDLIYYVDVVSLGEKRSKSRRVLISQPGLRYAQAEALIESIIDNESFNQIPAEKKAMITDRILSEIKGRMLEDIILLETKLSYQEKEVFVVHFSEGEFDMVIFDPKKINCDLFEIKHSREAVPEQYKHITDERKCALTTHFYGEITSRNVIYRGESKSVGNIRYVNVEEYLLSLPPYEAVTWL